MSRIVRFIFVLAFIAGTALFSTAAAGARRTLDLQSGDILCISCALNIKNNVSRMQGIKDVEVSASAKSIHVEYDDGKISEEQIIQKISDLGFKAKRI